MTAPVGLEHEWALSVFACQFPQSVLLLSHFLLLNRVPEASLDALLLLPVFDSQFFPFFCEAVLAPFLEGVTQFDCLRHVGNVWMLLQAESGNRLDHIRIRAFVGSGSFNLFGRSDRGRGLRRPYHFLLKFGHTLKLLRRLKLFELFLTLSILDDDL